MGKFIKFLKRIFRLLFGDDDSGNSTGGGQQGGPRKPGPGESPTIERR